MHHMLLLTLSILPHCHTNAHIGIKNYIVKYHPSPLRNGVLTWKHNLATVVFTTGINLPLINV